MHRGLSAKLATGARLEVPYCLSLPAMAHAAAGQPARRLPLVVEALDRLEKTGERWFEAEAHRIKGEVPLRLPDATKPRPKPVSTVRSKLLAPSAQSCESCVPR